MQFLLIAKYSSVSQVVYLLNKSLSAWLTVHPSLCAVLAGEGGDSQVQLRVPGGGVPVEQVSLLMVDCASLCVCSSCCQCVPGGGLPVEQVSSHHG